MYRPPLTSIVRPVMQSLAASISTATTASVTKALSLATEHAGRIKRAYRFSYRNTAPSPEAASVGLEPV